MINEADENLDEYGRSELHYAANEADVTRVQELLAEGFKPDLPDQHLWTPLHFAAQANSLEVARLLLDCGVPVDPRDENGNSPLSTAVFNSKGGGALIQLFRKQGADPYLANHYDQTPVGLARLIGNYDVAQYFKDLPAAPDRAAT